MNEVTLNNSMDSISSCGNHKTLTVGDESGQFVETLKNAINNVEHLHDEAEHAIRELASGDDQNIHSTMIAMEKAEISFKLMMQVRNKIVAAYEEISRMQI